DFTLPTDQLPQLDRHFVYGSFGAFDTSPLDPPNDSPMPIPTDTHPNPQAQPKPESSSATFFPGQMDPRAPSGTGEFHQPAAWFLPFNLDPIGAGPEAGMGFDPNAQ